VGRLILSSRKHITMQMTLLGVTGSTGQSLMEQALARDHHVNAIARNPAKIPFQHPNLQAFQGDVLSASTLAEAFSQSEVVISCVGVSSPVKARKGTTVYSVGTCNIVEVMRRVNLKRLIVVSSAGVAPRKGAPILYKLIVKPFFLEPAYRDMRLMEAFLGQTELDWTIVRPSYLTAAPLRTDYRLMPDHNFDDDRPLSRNSLAHFLVTEAESPRFVRKVVAISG
jgi:putative NADH-flavin reductase